METKQYCEIMNKANHAFEYGHWKKAYLLYKQLEPANGHVNLRLGVMYHKGYYVTPNNQHSEAYWKLAYEQIIQQIPSDPSQGEAEDLCDLGYMYSLGYGVCQNKETAIKYYQLAADKGYARGQSNLGFMYEHGSGVPKDHALAVKYYKLAADQGYNVGQCNLAYLYDCGIAKDEKEDTKKLAAKYYMLAANQGHTRALYNLALMYLSHQIDTKGDDSEKKAVRCYHTAALQGHHHSLKSLKNLFQGKEGNDLWRKGVEYLAEEWPASHPLLEGTCQQVVCVLFWMRDIWEDGGDLVVPGELVVEIIRFVILLWPKQHCVEWVENGEERGVQG